jgi:uncharacterized DUF497 family protein
MDFDWYSKKERLNLEKHGIDLQRVKRVFDDPFRIMKYDVLHSGLEDRWQTLGQSEGVVFAVYTERGEKVRVITAREATSGEWRIYYGEDDDGNWFVS